MAKRTSINKMFGLELLTALFTRRNDQIHILIAHPVAVQTFQHGEKHELAGLRIRPRSSGSPGCRCCASQRKGDDTCNCGEQEISKATLVRLAHNQILDRKPLGPM